MHTNIIVFPKKISNEVQKVKNVRCIPNLFANLLNQYKKRQDEIKQKKIKFLTDEAYRFYYDLLETPKISDVDLPEFIYEEQRRRLAFEKASKAMLEVIKDNRINKCYNKRIQEIKAANHKRF